MVVVASFVEWSEAKLEELRTRIAPLEAGAMNVGSRKPDGPWEDITADELVRLRAAVLDIEGMVARCAEAADRGRLSQRPPGMQVGKPVDRPLTPPVVVRGEKTAAVATAERKPVPMPGPKAPSFLERSEAAKARPATRWSTTTPRLQSVIKPKHRETTTEDPSPPDETPK